MTKDCDFIDCEEEGSNHREHLVSDEDYRYCNDHDPLTKDKLADFWKEADA